MYQPGQCSFKLKWSGSSVLEQHHVYFQSKALVWRLALACYVYYLKVISS